MEYDEVLQHLSEPEKLVRQVSDFKLFVSKWHHALLRDVNLLPSLACNFSVATAVTAIARARWENGTEKRPCWIWKNALPLSPCVMTEAVYPAPFDCCFSVNGENFAVAGNGGCTVYQTRSLFPLSRYTQHNGLVFSCCISPDSKHVISGAQDGTAHIWHLHTGDRVHVLDGHLGWVLGCDWCRTSDLVLTTSSDTTTRVWNPNTGNLMAILEGHQNRVTRGRFSLDGGFIATASLDTTVVVWNVATWLPLVVLAGHTAGVNDVRWSHDGNQISSASDDRTTSVWNAHSGEKICFLRGHLSEVKGCVFSPDSSEIVTCGSDMTMRVFTVKGVVKEFAAVAEHSDWVVACDWVDDKILTIANDGTAKIWQRSIMYSARYSPPDLVGSVFFSKDNTQMSVQHSTCSLKVAFPSLDTLSRFEMSNDYHSCDVSPDGTTRLIVTYSNSVTVIKNGTVAGSYEITGACNRHSCFSPDGKEAVTVGDGYGTVVRWDVSQPANKVTYTSELKTPVWVNRAVWSRDGKWIVVTSGEGTFVWDATNKGKASSAHRVFPAGYYCDITADGSLVAIVTGNGRSGYEQAPQDASVFDVFRDKKVCTLQGGNFACSAGIQCAADSQHVYVIFKSTHSYNSTVFTMYEASSGQIVASFCSPNRAAFSSLAVLHPASGNNETKPTVVIGDSSGLLFLLEYQG